MPTDYDRIRRDAMHWVRQAGQVGKRMLGRSVATRKADSSPVTDADHAVQEALLRAIADRYPQDAVITEETQSQPKRHAVLAHASRCWVIDPIDGTSNFARTVPMFSVSVGLMEEGRPVVGLIYDPTRNEMYSAALGAGAWLDDKPLPTRDPAFKGSPMIGVPAGQRHHLPRVVHRWLDECKLRNTGSTALHLAYVAAGGFDAMLVTECHLWDVAAGLLIGAEVGVVARRLEDGRPLLPLDLVNHGHDDISILAARPDVLETLWQEFRDAGGWSPALSCT